MAAGGDHHCRIDEVFGRHFVQTAKAAGFGPTIVEQVLVDIKERAMTATDADPRVVRWVMLTTFEGLFTPSAQSISKDLPAMEGRRSARRGKRKKGKSRQPLVACDDLVASMRAISE